MGQTEQQILAQQKAQQAGDHRVAAPPPPAAPPHIEAEVHRQQVEAIQQRAPVQQNVGRPALPASAPEGYPAARQGGVQPTPHRTELVVAPQKTVVEVRTPATVAAPLPAENTGAGYHRVITAPVTAGHPVENQPGRIPTVGQLPGHITGRPPVEGTQPGQYNGGQHNGGQRNGGNHVDVTINVNNWGQNHHWSPGREFRPPEGNQWGWQDRARFDRGWDPWFFRQDPNCESWQPTIGQESQNVVGLLNNGDTVAAKDTLNMDLWQMRGDIYAQNELLNQVNTNQTGQGASLYLGNWDPSRGTWDNIEVVSPEAPPGYAPDPSYMLRTFE